ncbi:hypothetical protein BB561_002135 [Smittium simulii]|uniref:Glutathione hydrolase n=1 Tax=Smittium simulii TaxID=133385 RepID=A0A2T9YRQ2_9FUNG|nr:hypothetical protein BB561_002135 [Smittium simulii]
MSKDSLSNTLEVTSDRQNRKSSRLSYGLALVSVGIFAFTMIRMGHSTYISNNIYGFDSGSVEVKDRYNSNIINNILPKLESSKDFGLNLKVRQSLFPNTTNPVDSEQAFGTRGAVATDERRCSNIGLEVLKEGGSAVDAAISSGICVGFLNSFASGIGGGGFMVIRTPEGKSELIDFREEAPAAASELMFKENATFATVGGLSSGIPGEIRGYELAHKRYGRLSWKRLLEPTIKLARDGYAVGKMLAYNLNRNEKLVNSTEGFKQVYLGEDGKPLKEGVIAKRVNLANTLQKIADEGADAFYKGDLAKKMVSWLKKTGGVITEKDFADYSAKIRKTSVFEYRGRKIITGTPPTSGSIVGFTYNIIEGYDFKDESNKPTNVHRYIEALKFAYSQRTRIADPDYENITETLSNQQNKEFAAATRKNITDDKTHPYEYYNPEYSVEDGGTTHLSVLDKDGMAVSMTSTINLTFGSKNMDPVTGVIFNNEMDDFSTPGLKNAFGYSPSPKGYIKPGKRPLSSTSALIVENNGKPEIVLGASGGSRIITSTAQVLLNLLEFGNNLKEAVDYPRMHHQLLPNTLEVEPNFPNDIRSVLVSKGHDVKEVSVGQSVVQGIRALDCGVIHAVSDGRKFGAPAAY